MWSKYIDLFSIMDIRLLFMEIKQSILTKEVFRIIKSHSLSEPITQSSTSSSINVHGRNSSFTLSHSFSIPSFCYSGPLKVHLTH
jgi:hypothetical protein